MVTVTEGLCFDDVLLRPKFSNIVSRADVDLTVKIKDFTFKHPFVPANMATVTESEMAAAIYQSGGLALIHRFMPHEIQLGIFRQLQTFYYDGINNHKSVYYNPNLMDPSFHIGLSVGIREEDKAFVDQNIAAGVKIICVDIAHAHSDNGMNFVKWIKNKYPEVLLIAGSVATYTGARDLWYAGADVIKVGIGNGSICSTRIVTGCGVPQVSALIEINEEKARVERSLGRKLYIMSDGGATVNGDVVKALCLSDLVMSGLLFAGCLETPGERQMMDGVLHKQYQGSSTHKLNRIEGVKSWTPVTVSFNDVLKDLTEAVQSGCSYQGAHNLEELKHDPVFIKITSAGMKESQPHNVLVK